MRPECKCGRGRAVKGRAICQKCENERINEWRRKHPTYHREYGRNNGWRKILKYKEHPDFREEVKERVRRWRYMKLYGITVEQFDLMLEMQGGRCKLCKQGPRNEKSRLHVDHCHESERVRGLLCYRCNAHRVRQAKDSEAELYQDIADYLKSAFDGRKIKIREKAKGQRATKV